MGPLFKVATNVRVRLALRAKGYSRAQINFAIDCIDDDMIASAMTTAGVDASAIGDGTIIGAIIDWLKSPQGQAFLDALLKLLLGLLMGLGKVESAVAALFPETPEVMSWIAAPFALAT